MGQICFSLILVANISRMSLRILISAINKANYTVTINREQIPHVCPGEMMKKTTILLQVRCVFVTDGLQLEENQKESLLKERNIFGDIVFSPTQNDAVMYGHRFLYLIMWAKAKFNFQYLLRLDDDYFVCMDRMVNELHFRPKRSLSWGWYHCSMAVVWMDEAWSLFSADVIDNFLTQDPRSMLCHPFGDQTFSLWINATGVNLTEFHDQRLHHTPRAGKMKKFFSMKSVCDKYIGIHGSYNNLMPRLWKNSNDAPKNITPVTLLRATCDGPKVFDVSKFRGIYRHEPKPCIEGFNWGPIPWRSKEN